MKNRDRHLFLSHFIKRIREGRCLLIIIFIFLLNACSYAPDVLRMIPPEAEYMGYTNSYKSINIEMVKGGDETNIFRPSSIDNEVFFKAIEQSLIKSHLFAAVNAVENPDYILKVTILSQEKPFTIINVTVKLLVLYQIVSKEGDSEFWSNTIATECTKTLGDEFMGSKREQKAYECVARENIRQLMEELSKQYL